MSLSAITDVLPSSWIQPLTTHRHHLGNDDALALAAAAGLNFTLSGALGDGSGDGGIGGADAPPMFQHERLIAALSILFCRLTVTSTAFSATTGPGSDSAPREPFGLRVFFSVLLAVLAYAKRPYDVICALQMFSYAVPILLPQIRRGGGRNLLSGCAALLGSGVLSFLLCRGAASGELLRLLGMISPTPLVRLIKYLFPIDELAAAHAIVLQFTDSELLQRQVDHLLFVTFNIQVGIGYLGIGFLKAEQMRRNMLVRMEVIEGDAEEEKETSSGNVKKTTVAKKADSTASSERLDRASEKVREKQLLASKKFRRSAAPFIFFTVVPYMFQIIFFGNMNMFAFTCVKDDIHRMVREGVFESDGTRLVKLAQETNTSPDAFATSMDTVVATSYDMFNRKLFSLPKLALLPGVIMKQPGLLVQIFPLIFFSDIIKARLVSTITNKVEQLDKDAREIQEIRRKVESFDMKNAELLHRSGAGAARFTQRRWEELTEQIQDRRISSELLKRTRGFFTWLQRNFVFSALIDCALARMIAVGRITSADIFVFSRAIEDAVDLLLMRSRAESELATMMTEINKLGELSTLWEKSSERMLLPCHLPQNGDSVMISNLLYSRGTAMVRADQLELKPGIYAITGPNGSGKSTLFRVLMSCGTNQKSIDLPSSILLETPRAEERFDTDISSAPNEDYEVSKADAANGYVEPIDVPILSIGMPSTDVVEISQTFYWPLFTKPADWIYQMHLSDLDESKRQAVVSHIASHLMELQFVPTTPDDKDVCYEGMDEGSVCSEQVISEAPSMAPSAPPVGIAKTKLEAELLEEKEDWFSDLSGGQRSKVELVRKVFLHEKCPMVLLIDETMAPLDPESKSLVMSKLKQFCSGSIVLVIYHTDVGRTTTGNEEEEDVECVPSNNFFDHNIHVQNRMLTRRAVC